MASIRDMRDRLNLLVTKLIPEAKLMTGAAQKQQAALEKEATDLTLKLTPRANDAPSVSEHAVLRFLERRYKLDIEAIKAEILTPERIKMVEAGVREIAVDGVRFRIQNNTVVTVI